MGKHHRADEEPNREVRSIAEMLHNLKCQLNHEDGCTWYWTNWETATHPYSAREIYRRQAVYLLEYVPYHEAANVLSHAGGAPD